LLTGKKTQEKGRGNKEKKADALIEKTIKQRSTVRAGRIKRQE